ncbi:MAG: phosphoenolpyruvate carboxylase [Xanthomonadales bacterium]|nr:phosphoenolpyruvate carboxylase [Xanthomonadales bacterium]
MEPERLREVEFPEVDQGLKDDVRRLGALVGEMLAEQNGHGFLAEIERLRIGAIRRRERAEPIEAYAAALRDCTPRHAERLARAFATYFQVVNVAERVHRIRRRRHYQIHEGGDQPGGLHETLETLKQAGFDADAILAQLARIDIEPVFTAHPTEAIRQSLLQKEEEIVRCLLAEIGGLRTPGETATDWARMRTALTAGWQTATLAPIKPDVSDELEHTTHYLVEPIYRSLPIFYEVLVDGFERKFGVSPEIPTVLRFASWVGGDMDGNPNVGPETIAAALARHRRLILGQYAADLKRLAGLLSQTEGLASFSTEVYARRDHYLATMPEVAALVSPRHRDMPYRVLLRLMRARIEASANGGEHAYRDDAEFIADLETIRASLHAHKGDHAGGYALRRMLWRVRTFGFHLARLDLRQDARVHRRVLLAADPQLATHAQADTRIAELARGDALAEAALEDPLLDRARRVFSTVADMRRRYGRNAIGLYIISMAANASDVLSVIALARAGKLLDANGQVPLDIAPLFETIEDLQQAPQTLTHMLEDAVYRQHLAARGNRQFVMLGYSDSAKDGGLLAARWALQGAQTRLLEVAATHAIELDFFHGRGGSASRGGGKTSAAILAAPRATMNGRLRVTEQGEVIHRKYGIDALALRTLAQTTAAVLTPSLLPPPEEPRERRWGEMMTTMAEASLAHYRALVSDGDAFVAYFRDATPIDVIERMSLGSRPARRGGAQIRDLRAIPWVFAWTQSRCVLTGWYGLGSALEAGVREFGVEAMREMARDWRFLASLLADVEMVIAKSDMAIARVFSQLSGTLHERFFPQLEAEHQRTREMLALLTERELLANDPRLARSIRLRNPYVDPMSLLQADLLARWRAADRPDDDLLRALITCVQGVSQALQNTG